MGELTHSPTRKTAAALLVVIFVLGAVCGAALFYLGQRSVRPPHRPDAPPADHPLARLARHLDLDAEQQAAIHEILEVQRVRLEELLEGSREEIRAVLRPEQQKRFDEVRPAHAGHPGGPPPPDHLQGPPPGHRPPPGYPPPRPGGPPPAHPQPQGQDQAPETSDQQPPGP